MVDCSKLVLGQVLVVYALLVVVSILCVFYVILRRPKLSVQCPFKKLGIGRHKAGDGRRVQVAIEKSRGNERKDNI